MPKTRWAVLKGEKTITFKHKLIEEGQWDLEGETTLRKKLGGGV